MTGGLSARHRSGLYGRAGLAYVGDRPATEDAFLTAEGFFRLDLTAGWRTQRFALELTIQNATNSPWREAQFATTSRLKTDQGDTCPAGTRAVGAGATFEGCEDIHFTPGWPINAQLSASIYF